MQTRPRKRLAPEARREQIVEAAVRHYAAHGLAATTRDVARAAGVTQALLYQYFASKAELIDAVFERIYLGRIAPHWSMLVEDRERPLRERMVVFYGEYTKAIFTHDWMRIFMAAGLAGETLNRRYLEHLRDRLLAPMIEEVRAAARGDRRPEPEDLWNLHGGIVYIGIREHVYGLPVPADPMPAVEQAIDRFLRDFGIEP